jgi:hypothetical protein
MNSAPYVGRRLRMGTTATTNLALIKPDTDESIKANLPTFAGWATQNGLNCDKIDSLFRHTTHTYTPTFTGSGGNPTLGAGGSVSGKYIRFLPRLVLVEYRVDMGGAGFAAGSGTYALTLPVAVPTELTTFDNSIPVGKAFLDDNSTVANATVLVAMYSVANLGIFFRPPVAAVWNPTSPFTLAQNDKLSGYALYPTSAV